MLKNILEWAQLMSEIFFNAKQEEKFHTMYLISKQPRNVLLFYDINTNETPNNFTYR